jgi:monofunctional glycosyltransferase
VTERPDTHTKILLGKDFVRSSVRWLVVGVVVAWSLAAMSLLAARWIDPPSTVVHIQRRLQAWLHHTPYRERYKFIPLSQIPVYLQHAVIAAEDARFYQHHGFDWHGIQIAAEEDLEGGRTRGASTITQQLVKNLFFGTGRSVLRKGAEFTLVPVAEFVLGNDAFWRSTSTWSNGALAFMVQRRRVATTKETRPGISVGNRRHGSPRFCRLP